LLGWSLNCNTEMKSVYEPNVIFILELELIKKACTNQSVEHSERNNNTIFG